MTDPRQDTPAAPDVVATLDRLRAHRTLSQVPTAELEWLVEHGSLHHYAAGETIIHKGDEVPWCYAILKGRLSHFLDQGGVRRKAIGWREGDITGHLPYSRMRAARGTTVIDEPVEAWAVPREDVATMPVACPHLTTLLVHAMLDRAREFKSSDLQLEKLASLGKLAAGMAHELNNPASAAARCARQLSEALPESHEASRRLGAAGLSASEEATLDRVRRLCLAAPTGGMLSALERADREESIFDWLRGQSADESLAASLAETDVQLEHLAELAEALPGEKLDAALRALGAACTVQGLVRDIEQASSRVHELVGAVKSFTYMDRGFAPGGVDVRKGLTDTVAVLASKAQERAAALNLEAALDLPPVWGFGGELNQVWVNLIDNALDAVEDGGRVTVTAQHVGETVVVRVIDDGPGIAEDVKSQIFDPFFTTKPVGAGTGLGLDVAQRFVDRHEGLIAVTSEPGRTEFQVTLPVSGPKTA